MKNVNYMKDKYHAQLKIDAVNEIHLRQNTFSRLLDNA